MLLHCGHQSALGSPLPLHSGKPLDSRRRTKRSVLFLTCRAAWNGDQTELRHCEQQSGRADAHWQRLLLMKTDMRLGVTDLMPFYSYRVQPTSLKALPITLQYAMMSRQWRSQRRA